MRPTIRLTTLLVLFAALTGCQNGPAKIGVVLPLTGEHAAYGEASQKGIDLAWEVLQEKGSPSIEILATVDSASDPQAAAAALEGAYDGGALAVIGGLTAPETALMTPVAEQYERVLLSPSLTDNVLLAGSRQVYSLAPSDRAAGSTLGGFAARDLKVRTAALLAAEGYAAADLEAGFRAALENLGGEVLAVTEVPAGGAATLVSETMALKPDALVLAGENGKLGEILREVRSQGYKGKILTTRALTAPGNVETLGKAAVGVLVAQTVLSAPASAGEATTDGPMAEFAERYQAKYGEAPDVLAAEAYDAVMVMAAAMNGRHPLASEVREGLRDEIKNFPGVTGEIQFNDKGGVGKYPRVYSVSADLSLRDHSKLLEEERERIRLKKKELEDRLRNLGSGSIPSAGGSP